MLGPVEIDETDVGDKARNRHASQRNGKRGVEGKWAVVGILDRATGQVQAEAVDDTKKDELLGYLEENVMSDATVYSDQARGYDDLPQTHFAGRRNLPCSFRVYCCPGWTGSKAARRTNGGHTR